jgi:hypothetical protein
MAKHGTFTFFIIGIQFSQQGPLWYNPRFSLIGIQFRQQGPLWYNPRVSSQNPLAIRRDAVRQLHSASEADIILVINVERRI